MDDGRGEDSGPRLLSVVASEARKVGQASVKFGDHIANVLSHHNDKDCATT